MQLADVHSRAGSVIVAADAVVPSDTVRSSAASVSVALLDITGLNVTVAGHTGPVGAVVGGLTGELECQCTLSPVVLSVCLPFRRSISGSVRRCSFLSIIRSLYLSVILPFYPSR